MKRTYRILGVCMAAALFAASCGSEASEGTGSEGNNQEGDNKESKTASGDAIDICVSTHAAEGDSFWGVVQKAVDDAAGAVDANITYTSSNDVNEQANFLTDCVEKGTQGVVVSLANPEGMESAVKAASDKGVPIITINSGSGSYDFDNVIGHVGQEEDIAGEGAGKGLNDAGVSGKVICVVHESGNVSLESRCKGLEETYEGEVENFDVSSTGTQDSSGTQDTLTDKLGSDSDVAAVMTLNPDVAGAAREAISSSSSEAKLATFDLGSEVLDGIESGDILFAIDQQPYLQGYLPIVHLRLKIDNENVVGGGQPVLSGPSLVTTENVEAIKELIDSGTR